VLKTVAAPGCRELHRAIFISDLESRHDSTTTRPRASTVTLPVRFDEPGVAVRFARKEFPAAVRSPGRCESCLDRALPFRLVALNFAEEFCLTGSLREREL